VTIDPTAAARRARYKERHGGRCVDCGARTSLTKIGEPSERCRRCRVAHVAPEHGTRSRYMAGCHCDACRAAHAMFQRYYYHRRAARLILAERPS
jgi:hypothetical protein